MRRTGRDTRRVREIRVRVTADEHSALCALAFTIFETTPSGQPRVALALALAWRVGAAYLVERGENAAKRAATFDFSVVASELHKIKAIRRHKARRKN